MWGPLRDLWAVLAKDLLIELRTREILYSMVLFAVLVVVVFAFAFLGVAPLQVASPAGAGGEAGTLQRLLAPGILWTAITFAGTLGLNRIASRELDGDCLTGLVTSPASRGGIFFGKMASSLLFLLAMEALLLPLIVLLFGLDLQPRLGWHLLALLLGSLGFCALGTLFSTMLLNARLREVLLPLVFYPLVTPVIIAGVKSTAALLAGESATAFTWLKLLLAFDVVFTTAAAWAFGWTVGE